MYPYQEGRCRLAQVCGCITKLWGNFFDPQRKHRKLPCSFVIFFESVESKTSFLLTILRSVLSCPPYIQGAAQLDDKCDTMLQSFPFLKDTHQGMPGCKLDTEKLLALLSADYASIWTHKGSGLPIFVLAIRILAIFVLPIFLFSPIIWRQHHEKIIVPMISVTRILRQEGHPLNEASGAINFDGVRCESRLPCGFPSTPLNLPKEDDFESIYFCLGVWYYRPWCG